MKGTQVIRPIVIRFSALVRPHAATFGETTATLTVRSMDCAICSVTVREAIAKRSGMRAEAVDYRKQIAVVTIDDAFPTLDKPAPVSGGAGFPAERQE